MNKVVIVRGGWRSMRKFICLKCAMKIYPKWYLIKLLNKRMQTLSRTTKHLDRYKKVEYNIILKRK